MYRTASTFALRRIVGPRQLISRFRRRLRRHLIRLDVGDILEALRSLGHMESEVLLVHSSLSGCGFIDGGPPTLVEALREWVGERSLAMPTHTYCYPEPGGIAPLFHVTATSSMTGAVTDYFWRQPGVNRSVHPTHSLACCGPASEKLCEGHELCDTPCGRSTPYEKLVRWNSSVLMFAADLSAYTLFHTAEDAAGVAYLYEPERYHLRAESSEGQQFVVSMRRQDMRVARRFRDQDEWLEKNGLMVRIRLGWGELRYISAAAKVHRRVVEELKSNPTFLVQKPGRSSTKLLQKL